MSRRLLGQPLTRVVPWGEDGSELSRAVQEHIPYKALAVGVLDLHRPQCDELLVAHGWPVGQLAHWIEQSIETDRLVKSAMRFGCALAAPGETAESSLAESGALMVQMLPESTSHKKWWVFLLLNDRPFSLGEQHRAALLLRKWVTDFHCLQEPGMHRLIVGHDNRLMMADVSFQAALLEQPSLTQDLLDGLRPMIEQRYPNLGDRLTRDFAVEVCGQPQWVNVRYSRPGCDDPRLETDDARSMYLELRPLEKEELPVVGEVKDPRIARAIAYIHDHFSEAPSLADVARIVHISPFHFHRLFTRQAGVSPKHYLQRKQLQVAKWLLRKGGVPIGEIAKHTGFSSHGHFTSTFHRLTGASPSEYRDKHG